MSYCLNSFCLEFPYIVVNGVVLVSEISFLCAALVVLNMGSLSLILLSAGIELFPTPCNRIISFLGNSYAALGQDSESKKRFWVGGA